MVFESGYRGRGSSISVIDILAPVVPVVLDQGMLKEAYSMPVMIFLYWITVDFVACRAGLKSVRLGTFAMYMVCRLEG